MQFETGAIQISSLLDPDQIRHLDGEKRIPALTRARARRNGVEDRNDLVDRHGVDSIFRIGSQVGRGVELFQPGTPLQQILLFVRRGRGIRFPPEGHRPLDWEIALRAFDGASVGHHSDMSERV